MLFRLLILMRLNELVNKFYKENYEQTISRIMKKKIIREDAEDLVQEALIKTCQNLKDRHYKVFLTYMAKSVHSCYIDFVYRQRKSEIPRNKIVSLNEKFFNNLTYEEILSEILKDEGSDFEEGDDL